MTNEARLEVGGWGNTAAHAVDSASAAEVGRPSQLAASAFRPFLNERPGMARAWHDSPAPFRASLNETAVT